MFRSLSAIIPARTALFTAAITITQEANKMNLVPLGNIVAALVFAFVGIFIFVIAFMVMDKMTPYHLWKEIVQEHNMALAILVGAMSLGICVIIAAAIHSLMGILVFISVLLVAPCVLIYKLVAGTLASYLDGDSVFPFSTIIGSYLFDMDIGSSLSRY